MAEFWNPRSGARKRHRGRRKGGCKWVARRTSRSSGVVQVVVSLAILAAATAGTGQHNGVPSPTTVCTQLRVLSGSS